MGQKDNQSAPARSEHKTAASSASMPIKPTDIIIALMGVTGSGKTSFIQILTKDKLVIGHSIESCTKEVSIHKCILSNGKTVYLVDTPGFDDTYKSDTDILAELVAWLTAAYESNILLTGIIYLQRIQDPRLTGVSFRNLNIFKKLCGDDGLGQVVLATTFWNKVNREEGSRRERELVEQERFWGYLKRKGSVVRRHLASRDTAEEIVNHLIDNRKQPVVLQIQKEVVDDGKTLSQTAAGGDLAWELEKQRKQYEKQIKEMREQLEEAMRRKDADLRAELQFEREAIMRKLRKQKENEEMLGLDKDEIKKRTGWKFDSCTVI